MNEYPFHTFIDLIQFDQETQALHRDLRTFENEIAELDQKKRRIINETEEKRQTVILLKKEVDTHELTMKELDEIEAEKKKRLDEVSNQREYRSIQAELETVNRKQRALEDQLIGLWNKYETAQKQLEAQQTECTQFLEELDKTIDTKRAKIAEVAARINGREKDRSALEKELPSDWLEIYSTMRMRVNNPVVPVVGNSCSACFYPVSPQDLMMLKANKLVQCKGCYRLLYLEQKQEETEKTEGEGSEQA